MHIESLPRKPMKMKHSDTLSNAYGGTIPLTPRNSIPNVLRENPMSETTPPVNPPAAAEPQNPAEASAQKKQTVRISLPPKPAGGPSIRVPSAAATPAPVSAAPVAAPAAPAPAASVAAASMSSHATKAAAPAAPVAAAAAPVAKPAAPANRPAAKPASISGLDMGLAFAAMALGIAAVAAQFVVAN